MTQRPAYIQEVIGFYLYLVVSILKQCTVTAVGVVVGTLCHRVKSRKTLSRKSR